jgi:hypothetical protein
MTNLSGFESVKLIPLYARPLSGDPVKLPDNEEKRDIDESNCFSLCTFVTFPLPRSSVTVASHSEIAGLQIVADDLGVGMYVKNQKTTGWN